MASKPTKKPAKKAATTKVRPSAENSAEQRGRPFQKGQSGNPGGRPKVAGHIRELAREHGERAIERLVELMEGEDPRVARAAAADLLDRGYGKPSQPVGGADDLPAIKSERELTDAELAAIARGNG